MMKLSMRFGVKLKLKDKKDLLKRSRGYETTWQTVRKSQLKTLEDTAINSLSKLRYKGLTIEGLTDYHQDLCRLIVF